MFHEIFLPHADANMFRSPDVALLPFVGGSTHAVTTPLLTRGVAVVLAPAIAATTVNTNTAAATSSRLTVTPTEETPSCFRGSGLSAPRPCFIEARQEEAQVEPLGAVNGD